MRNLGFWWRLTSCQFRSPSYGPCLRDAACHDEAVWCGAGWLRHNFQTGSPVVVMAVGPLQAGMALHCELDIKFLAFLLSELVHHLNVIVCLLQPKLLACATWKTQRINRFQTFA